MVSSDAGSMDGGRINISLAEIPAGHYKLYADIATDPNGADISVWQRQTQVSEWISVKSTKKENKDRVYLGEIALDEFKNSISIVFKTGPDQNKLTLRRLIFEKQ